MKHEHIKGCISFYNGQHNYTDIVKYKTSYHTFYSPLAFGLIRVTDKEIFDGVDEFALKLGHLFQAQDDYIDCYGDPEITGKVRTDSVDGKSTWLLSTALQMGDKEQRNTLLSCIGSNNEINVSQVKAFHDELNIADRFKILEDEMFQEIISYIKKLHKAIPQKPLLSMLNTIYHRDH